ECQPKKVDAGVQLPGELVSLALDLGHGGAGALSHRCHVHGGPLSSEWPVVIAVGWGLRAGEARRLSGRGTALAGLRRGDAGAHLHREGTGLVRGELLLEGDA